MKIPINKNPIQGLVILIMLGLCTQLQAQQFWLTTNEFPGGPKTGIGMVNDSCMAVGLAGGIILSCDDGFSFDSILAAPTIFTVKSASNKKLLAGGLGKIYASNDLGVSWDTVFLNSNYPVTQFLENSTGQLFAITGTLDINLGFVGDGVYFSADTGATWQKRNQGLGDYTSCERIAVDKNNRLYLAVADEYVTGKGGLFVSDDNGLQWEHINISINGRSTINDQIKISNTTGLSISPHDSVYISFEGIAANSLVRLNLKKHIDDVKGTSLWKDYQVFADSITWWLDRTLYNIYFAKNGSWYSSTKGSVLTGATYYTEDGSQSWEKIDYGLGLTEFGFRDGQFFIENEESTVFMVQYFDERVYFHKKQQKPVLIPEQKELSDISIFPNPVSKASPFFINKKNDTLFRPVVIYDITGKTIVAITSPKQQTIAPETPGIYILYLEGKTTKLIVK